MKQKEKTKIQDEIVVDLPKNPHGILLLAPRVGKSRVAIEVIKKEKPETVLWVTLSTKLRDVDIPREFNTWGAEKYLSATTIVCWKSLHKIEGLFDLIILDELCPIKTSLIAGIP